MNIYPELLENRLKVAFIHIPKTGGKTFRQILYNQYDDCYVFRLRNPDRLKQLSELPIEDLATIDIIEGHFPYYSLPEIPRRFKFFTIMRDPIERIVSQYNYWANTGLRSNMPAQKIIKDNSMTFMDFVTNQEPHIKFWVFAYLTHFSDTAGFKTDTPDGIGRLVEQAARNLLTNFEFIGITERYDEGLQYLKKTYGFNLDSYKNENVTPEWAKTEVTEEEKEKIRPYLEPEYVLYDLAKQMFERRVNGHS